MEVAKVIAITCSHVRFRSSCDTKMYSSHGILRIFIITIVIFPLFQPSKSRLLRYLKSTDCLVYVTFTTHELDDDDDSSEMDPGSKSMPSSNNTANSVRLAPFLTHIPDLHSEYKPFLIQRQCDCSNTKFWFMSTNKFSVFQNFLEPYALPRCVDFLIFQRNPDQIKRVIQTYHWVSWWKATFFLLADLGLAGSGGPGIFGLPLLQDRLTLPRKLFMPLRVYKSKVIFTLTTIAANASEQWRRRRITFGILCYFCKTAWIFPVGTLTEEYMTKLHTILNRVNGHGAEAIIDRSFPLGDAKGINHCEANQFFEMQFKTDCTYDKIFLSIFASHFNFTPVSGDFSQADATKVLRICITFCYASEKYLAVGKSAQLFITSNEVTRFIYCQKSTTLEDAEWQSLTGVFDKSVWVGIFMTSIVFGIIGRDITFAFDYLFLIIGQPLQGKWKRWTPWIAMGLATTIFISNYYQGEVTSNIVAPLEKSKIETIKELFAEKEYKYIRKEIPSERDWVELNNFRSRGIPVLKLASYYVVDQELRGTSPASVWERVKVAGKYPSRGAVLLDASKIDYALAISRYIHPNLSCDSVKQTWNKYWDTWMLKSHLADRIYLTKFKLMQAGIYQFWKSILGYERYYFVQSQAAKRKNRRKDNGLRKISLNSSFVLVFKLFAGLVTLATFCFVIEVSWGYFKVAVARALYRNMR